MVTPNQRRWAVKQFDVGSSTRLQSIDYNIQGRGTHETQTDWKSRLGQAASLASVYHSDNDIARNVAVPYWFPRGLRLRGEPLILSGRDGFSLGQASLHRHQNVSETLYITRYTWRFFEVCVLLVSSEKRIYI